MTDSDSGADRRGVDPNTVDPNTVDPNTGGIRTPLFELHAELGGRMVDFGGHALPMRYDDGTVAEHRATRSAAGLFDVSHMGIIDVLPSEAEPNDDGADGVDAGRFDAGRLGAVAAWLERCVPGDVVNLGVGKMRYTMFTTSVGGVLDDLIVSNLGDRLRLVVNAVRTDADMALLRKMNGDPATHGHVRFRMRNDLALLALQGPAAAGVLARWAPAAADLAFMSTATMVFDGVSGEPVACEVSRCGYTGEDGFEIAIPAGDAAAIARLLLDSGEVTPAGLGARDTLRLEAGLPLVGHELTEATTPVEAGLGWSIPKRRRAEGGFPGAAIIARQLADGPPRRRVGIAAVGRRPIRDGTALHMPDTAVTGAPVGIVTSGGFGPTVDAPVAMAYVQAEHSAAGTELLAEGRKGPEPCRVAALPFTEHRFWRPS